MSNFRNEVWNYKGFQCQVILRKFSFESYYCGYVNVGEDVSEEIEYDICCHGGITYNENGVIGFDCAHYMDTIAKCNLNYCKKECEGIVDQLLKLGIKPKGGN